MRRGDEQGQEPTAGFDPSGPVDLQVLVRAFLELQAKDELLREQLEAVKKENEELRRLLARNSNNSHLPPSSDGPGGRSRGAQNDKPKAEHKKRGPKHGHKGSHRVALGPEWLTDTIDVFPDCCSDCGAALAHVAEAKPAVHQHVDLNDRFGVVVHEYRRHSVRCPACGAKTRLSAQQAGVPRYVYGKQLTSLVTFMTGGLHVPRRGVRTFISEILGLKISLGTISSMEARATAALESTQTELLQHTQEAEIKHTDASTWLTAGQGRSITTIATGSATVFAILPDGGRKAMSHLFGKNLKGVLVTDRAPVYLFWDMSRRQICWEHLRRKFVGFSERDGPARKIGEDLHKVSLLVFEYWDKWRNGSLTDDKFCGLTKKLRKSFGKAIQRGIASGTDDVPGVCRNIQQHEDALWTFADKEGVPPSNNHAERELRSIVTWRKVSFGSQSDRGERFAERVMGVMRTCRKLKINVVAYLRSALTAHIQGMPCPKLLPLPNQA